jgi:hypothetical protein
MALTETNLEQHRRGDTLLVTFSLPDGYTGAEFTGGVLITFKRRASTSDVLDDTDAIFQGSVADGTIILAAGASACSFEIDGDTNATWPAERILWDIQARIVAGNKVHTLASGTIPIVADITRG